MVFFYQLCFCPKSYYTKEQNTHERIQKIETSCRPHRKKTGCPKFWFWHLLQHMMMLMTTTRLIIIEMSNLPWKISEWEGVFVFFGWVWGERGGGEIQTFWSERSADDHDQKVGAKSAFQDFLWLKIQMKRGPESMIQYVKMFYFGFQDTRIKA
jgi:hypothetical protein